MFLKIKGIKGEIDPELPVVDSLKRKDATLYSRSGKTKY